MDGEADEDTAVMFHSATHMCHGEWPNAVQACEGEGEPARRDPHRWTLGLPAMYTVLRNLVEEGAACVHPIELVGANVCSRPEWPTSSS